MTRRIMKPQPVHHTDPRCNPKYNVTWMACLWRHGGPAPQCALDYCPYGVPGDRLWVRETLRKGSAGYWLYAANDAEIRMAHDDPRVNEMVSWAHHQDRDVCVSIHMPRWASRLTLEVTDVRVERLQAISRGDAMAEGCPFPNMQAGADPRQWYSELWETINGAGSWDANPWVWVLTFKRVDA